MSNTYKKINFSEFLDAQTIESNGIRRNPMMEEGKPISYLEEDVRTLHELFIKGLQRSNGGPCVGKRSSANDPYTWITYQEVLDQTQQFGSGLLQYGAKAENSQFIGIYSQNCVEWKVTEQACNSFSMVLVPLYDTLGPESIEHIVNLCELKIIVIDTNQKAINLLSGIKDGKYKIETLILMENPSSEVMDSAAANNTEVLTFSHVQAKGKSNLQEFVPPTPEDLHTICFTSGTTGMPKGVMLSHGNLIANIMGIYGIGKDSFISLSNEDVHISYLPLAHVFERVVSNLIYCVGGSVGFFQGDIKLLLSDVAALKPTMFPMVPRLINRLFDKIHQGASNSRFKSFMLSKATQQKVKGLEKGSVSKNTWWDTLVFRKIQRLFGGRVKICITGAAPISSDVLNFMRCALGVPFSEGYGQTESTAAISISLPGDYFSGSVGTPGLCNEVKLVDVPEKNYFAKDGKGEVCARGTNIFKGYYKDEEKTKEALDEDGWLHTGDVGMWLPNGSLKIIDRKKHIFKLSQGEYIAPEKIEQILVQSVPVAQVFVYGESLKSNLVSIVVPDVETLSDWASSNGIKSKSYQDLCKNKDLAELIHQDLVALGKRKGLKSFELPKRIFLSEELFSVENNLLTPTFKARRPQIFKRYKTEIDKLYEGLD